MICGGLSFSAIIPILVPAVLVFLEGWSEYEVEEDADEEDAEEDEDIDEDDGFR